MVDDFKRKRLYNLTTWLMVRSGKTQGPTAINNKIAPAIIYRQTHVTLPPYWTDLAKLYLLCQKALNVSTMRCSQTLPQCLSIACTVLYRIGCIFLEQTFPYTEVITSVITSGHLRVKSYVQILLIYIFYYSYSKSGKLQDT